jgi:hypothetical protein
MTSPQRFIVNFASRIIVTLALESLAVSALHAQTPTSPPAQAPTVPAWAQPGSATHTQVAPPSDFHRSTTTFSTPIGIFEGQSDVGSAVLPGSASYDATMNTFMPTGSYTIHSAGYNIWYNRDEFRFLWKKLSGDVTLAADVNFPNPKGYDDRKAVIIIRQSLDDNSQEVLAGLHGSGMLQFAQRPEKNVRIKDIEYRIDGRGRLGGASPDSLVTVAPKRIGLEKRGDSIALLVSVEGEPLHQFGPAIQLLFDGPFYVGIGFCSHVPDEVDTAVFSNVTLETSPGKVP